MSGIDCLAAGSAVFDVLLIVERVPLADERVAARQVVSGGGGPAATAANAMARLGLRVELVSAVGDDLFGRLILEELRGQGVGVDAVQVVAGASNMAAVMITRTTGQRSLVVCSGCLQRIDTAAIPQALLQSAGCVLLDGNNPALAIELASRARRLRVPVYLDGGNIDVAVLDELLPLVDVHIPDVQSVAKQLGEGVDVREACRVLHAKGPKLVCITEGAAGSVAFDGRQHWHVPAYRGAAIADTTGAGDNFHGAFVFAHRRGWDMDTTLRFANTFAALCCRGIGGRASVPDYPETTAHVSRFG